MSLFDAALHIVEKLRGRGYLSYFAGGWVRDSLMQVSSSDIDIATEAPIQEVESLFSHTIPVGISFGIVIVVERGHHFEVATFRKDLSYSDGRRPEGIEPADASQDAARRDFTINGLFFDPIEQKVIDYVEGRKDLEQGVIRAIGDPSKRFLEDRLRMIRAVRYANRFQFYIEKETEKAILENAHLLFPSVAIERVWNELCKMAMHPPFDRALALLHRLKLLPIIFPDLKKVEIQEIQNRLKSVAHFPEGAPVIAKVLELFPSYSLEEKERLATYLKLSNKERDFVGFLEKAEQIFGKKEVELCQWAHLYAHPSFSLCLKIHAAHLSPRERRLFLKEHEERTKKLKEPIERIQTKRPYLTSAHLREVGIPNGPRMGQLLKEGEQIAINKNLKDPQKIIEQLNIKN